MTDILVTFRVVASVLFGGNSMKTQSLKQARMLTQVLLRCGLYDPALAPAHRLNDYFGNYLF